MNIAMLRINKWQRIVTEKAYDIPTMNSSKELIA